MSEYIAQIQEKIKCGDICVLNFSATWCGPCKRIAPQVVDLAKNNPNIWVFKIDVDEYEEYSDQCNISSIPVFMVYSKNKLISRIDGADIKKVEAAVRSLANTTETSISASK